MLVCPLDDCRSCQIPDVCINRFDLRQKIRLTRKFIGDTIRISISIYMGNISGMQVREVIRLYSSNNSILETARAAGLSTVKVRKILITEGLWKVTQV